MDGFHLTRAQLDGMPDPALAHTWRGADWTFDGQAYAAFVRALRSPVADAPPSPPHSPQPLVWAPSFDHAVKDPVPADIAVLPSHRIVLLEGNYTALDREPWRAANALLDERWFIHIDFEAATQRLIARHVAAGIAPDEILAEARARQIDLVNAADVVNHLMHIDELILSSNLMSQPTTPEVAISPLDE